MRYEEFTIEGRNAVIEAYRAGQDVRLTSCLFWTVARTDRS